MVVYLLDTSTISLLMRDDPLVDARMAGLGETERVLICTIVRGEVLYGIDRLPEGARRRALIAKARKVLGSMACEPIQPGVSDHYAQLKHPAELAGTAQDDNDLWIAATARSLGAVLVTTDTDYAHLTALTVEDWTKTSGP